MLDLHTHSIFSDGFFTPTELLEKAYSKGIRLLALTDHDTVDGVSEFLEASKKYDDLHILVGCEVSSNFTDDADVHVLALNIKDKEKISKHANGTNHLRRERIKLSIKTLQDNGYDIDYDRDIKKKDFGALNDRDITDILLNRGIMNNRDEAKALVKKGGIAYHPMYKFFSNVIDTINIINGAGAISVLAHPHTLKLNDEDLEKYIKNLVDNGLQGLECYHSNSTLEQTEFYLKLANKFNLIITGGSDHHGKPDETHKDFGISNRLQQKIPGKIAEYFLENIIGY